VCRETAVSVNKPSESRRIASAKTRAAVVSLAGEDRRLAATVDQWDANPWLLNTPGGVVDLHTGALRDHRPEDYMTKITAVTPGGDCPTWKNFIAKVTNNDDALGSYLARVSGYALTGMIGEHALWFFWGKGRNGKSQYLIAVSTIMADYHCAAPIEVFTESPTDRHPTELAMLRGARLVTAVEPEKGRRWSETRIKQLTGGDPIRARFMRQDFFQYGPQFKLMFAGNNKPGLRSVDEAISARMNIVPFTVVIPAKDRIKDFAEQMVKTEGSGILSWMIAGCLEWQRQGLNPPDVVTTATKDYLANQDVRQAWFDQRCIRDAQMKTLSSLLFGDWKQWAERRNIHVGSQVDFTDWLEGLEFEKKKTRNGMEWIGVGVTTASGEPNPPASGEPNPLASGEPNPPASGEPNPPDTEPM
jgi:putative DNA primase/helicase